METSGFVNCSNISSMDSTGNTGVGKFLAQTGGVNPEVRRVHTVNRIAMATRAVNAVSQL